MTVVWKWKVGGSDPYNAASCPLRSAAGSEKWGTMMAASWESSTTYSDRTQTAQLKSSSSLWSTEGTWCHCGVGLCFNDRHRNETAPCKSHVIKNSIWEHKKWMSTFPMFPTVTSDQHQLLRVGYTVLNRGLKDRALEDAKLPKN